MRCIRAGFVAFSLPGFLLAVPGPADADIVVQPVSLSIAANRSGTVTISNPSAETVRMQVTAYAWREDERGRTMLSAPQGLVVYPLLFTILPFSEQRVRAASVDPPAAVERSFRMMIEALPTASAAPGAPGVSLRTRFSIPVFVAPASPTPASGHTEAVALHRSTISFSVVNGANVRLGGPDLLVEGWNDRGTLLFAQSVGPWYVLAESRRVFTTNVPQNALSSLRTVTLSTPASPKLKPQTFNVKNGDGQ